MINCKNCDHTFEGNYCNNCGQTAHTHKINTHYLWHEIQHDIFHVDAGILYTAKELIINPGATIRNFIEGKRVRYFKPVAMIFLLATFYGLLYHYFNIHFPSSESTEEYDLIEKLNLWISKHYALATLLLIPVYSLASLLFFRKSGYNYVEHGILNLYMGSVKLILSFLIFPLFYIYNGTNEMLDILVLTGILDLFLNIWIYYSFFINYKPFSRIIRTFFCYLFPFIIMIIVGIAISAFSEINK